MSNELSPKDFGLPVLPLVPMGVGRACKICKDRFYGFRWSEYFCPDCDIKRMANVDKGMKEIAKKIDSTDEAKE